MAPAAGRRHLIRSLRARVTAGATAIVALILVLGAVVAVSILGRVLTDSVADSLEQDVDSLSSQVDASPSADSIIDTIDDDNLVRLDGASTLVNHRDAATLPTDGTEDDPRSVTVDEETYLVMSEETDAGLLTVARPTEVVDETVASARGLLTVGVPLVVLLVAVVVWIVVGRALAPVETLRRQVDTITADDLSRRVDAGDDELGALAATMNRMLARLDHAQTVQRRFVSDASHELRSPLATMRQHAEVAAAHPETTTVPELAGVVREEGERMQDLVEDLLLLARLDENHRAPTETVDLDDLVLVEAGRLRRAGTGVDTSGVGAGRVTGSARQLGRVVRNLVANAGRHAHSRVTLGLSTTGDRVVLTVADDGSGVPPEDRERIFDRFTRLDEGRARDAGGSGLGLAIVREVVEVHGGTVTVGESGAGTTAAGTTAAGGAVFTVVLPAAVES